MDLSCQPRRIQTFYLRTAQMLRKIRKNKSTIKTEVYKTPSPHRYLPLLHKVMLNYDALSRAAEKLEIAKDTALGAVLVYEILNGTLKDESWGKKVEGAIERGALKEPKIRTFVRMNTLKMREEDLEGYSLVKTCIPAVYEVTKPSPDTNNSGEGECTKMVYEDEEVMKNLKFQSLPSCLPAFLLAPEDNSAVIDATAAPGNKTTHLCSIMNNTGKIYAFERDKGRYKILEKRVKEYGATNVETRLGDFLKADPDELKADYILVDPSCSGSGIHLDYKEDPERLKKLKNIQAMLLNHAFKFSPRRVVYSTCSVHAEEGEEVVKEVLSKNPSYIIEPVGSFWEQRGHPGYEFSDEVARSGAEEGEKGFFVAVFRKKEAKDDSGDGLAL